MKFEYFIILSIVFTLFFSLKSSSSKSSEISKLKAPSKQDRSSLPIKLNTPPQLRLAPRKIEENIDQRLPIRNRKIVKFVSRNLGKKVGNGNCWDFGQLALIAAGGKRPNGLPYVWGKEITHDKKVISGDIIQTFKKGQEPEGMHTAIIYAVHEAMEVTIAEQNFNGQHFVTTRRINLRKLMIDNDIYI